MARPVRLEFEGAVYHVTVRGNGRQRIFRDDDDRRRFLTRLAEAVETHGLRLFLFCLMDNHFHLVARTARANLGRFMQGLQTAYAVYFNRRHGRVGHVTQGRYTARLVEADRYLQRLSRYVHLNPVRVGGLRGASVAERVRRLRAYPWSSYRGYVGLAPPLEFVDYEPVLADMGPSRDAQAKAYRAFVEGGLAETDAEFAEVLKASPRSIGGEAFRRWAEGLVAKRLRRGQKTEDFAHHRSAALAEAEEVLRLVSAEVGVPAEAVRRRAHGGLARPIAARMLCRYAGLTQRGVAELLGLGTGAAISMQLKKLRRLEAERRSVARLVARVETQVRALAAAAADGEPGTEF